MNRRSVLGMLGLGAAAGPAVVQQMATNPVSPVTSGFPSPGIGKQYIGDQIDTPFIDKAQRLKEMQDQLSIITDESEKWLAEQLAQELKEWRMGYTSIHYANIDPDIRNMKSITESAKMRMYFERKVRRQLENNKDHLMRNIAMYMGLV
jgi:phosphoribosylaminoimidazole carboxylase (NCAIR synthetase)